MAGAAVHEPVGVGPLVTVLQVVAVHAGSVLALAVTGVQLATDAEVVTVLQLVATQEFPDAAAIGVQLETPVGPVTAVPQLVAV